MSLANSFPLRAFLLACFVWALSQPCAGYSVLTHEQIIDLAWKTSIEPLLLARFPNAKEPQLREAHAYAYGGCAIQDMGYYPFGHEFFSDLTHYVRTGHFIESLLSNARTLDEYAFALGALSHYVSDNIGHQDAVNPATAIQFPKLERRYGAVVTYGEAPHAHVRTEFAFDINQLSHHRLAPAAYLRFVGFQVSRGLLERAFFETYGLRLRDVLGDATPAIRSYRTSVRSFLPRIAYAESVLHRGGFPDDVPNDAFREYEDRLARADYAKRWEKFRRSPRFSTYLLAGLIRILPKVGILSDLAIRGPNTQAEERYVESVNRTMATYQKLLGGLAGHPKSNLNLADRDLDTGEKVRPGLYALTDQTYARLLHQITAHPQQGLPGDLRRDILEYYSNPDAPITTKTNARAWRRVTDELVVLQGMTAHP